ncbi:MAG: lipoyl(octanoyl) transferase LipB [Ignavibacteria bacterium]|nr:lipoyl(octanoyl) transferase LipB [Ignavibacteria bacterium]
MIITDWGLIEYQEAWKQQLKIADDILHHNVDDTLVFCEHPAVITLGRTTQAGSIVESYHSEQFSDVPFFETDRGGEATVHNPGQLVGYPVFNLMRTTPDLHWFLRSIEEAIIDALSVFHIEAHRIEGLTGVWVGGDRKICAIGIHCRKWVTTHGFALNVSNDLALFNTIIPCGIHDKSVTSILAETGISHSIPQVREEVSKSFIKVFSLKSVLVNAVTT